MKKIKMTMIAAVTSDGTMVSVGDVYSNNDEYQRDFDLLTSDQVVVVDPEEWERYPARSRFPNRIKIVAWRSYPSRCREKAFGFPARVAKTYDDVFRFLGDMDDVTDVYLLGGQGIYRYFWSYCSVLYLAELNIESPVQHPEEDACLIHDEWKASKVVEREAYTIYKNVKKPKNLAYKIHSHTVNPVLSEAV